MEPVLEYKGGFWVAGGIVPQLFEIPGQDEAPGHEAEVQIGQSPLVRQFVQAGDKADVLDGERGRLNVT